MLFDHCVLHFVFYSSFLFISVFGRSLVLPFVNGISETKRKQDRSAMFVCNGFTERMQNVPPFFFTGGRENGVI